MSPNVNFFISLPKLTSTNFAEGVVIKSIKTIYLDGPKGKFRAIVKKKIEEFSEKMVLQEKNHKTASVMENIKGQLLSLVTENRLKNVISKYGRVTGTKQQRSKLQELMVEDVLDAFLTNFPQQQKIQKDEIGSYVEEEVQKVVNKYFDKK